MNIDQIKKEFPIFDEKIQNNDLVYLDSANSSQKPKVVIDRINEFYTKQFSNVGRSVHYLAVAATNLYENTRVLPSFLLQLLFVIVVVLLLLSFPRFPLEYFLLR